MSLWFWLIGALLAGGAVLLTVKYLNMEKLKKLAKNLVKEYLRDRNIKAEPKTIKLAIKRARTTGNVSTVDIGLTAILNDGRELTQRDVKIEADEISEDIKSKEGKVLKIKY